MKKQNLILSAALAAVFSASTAFAEAEVTGKIVHESGFYSNAGSTIGDYGVSTANGSGLTCNPVTRAGCYTGVTSTDTPSHAKNDASKRETTAKIYVDGELDELTDGATYHVELNLMTDGKGGTNYDSNESYTQRDALREAYIDTETNDWSIRAGKQQVVWGTADGMKLLDAINPTDYSEMAQNQMEDSRIPVWMLNAEKDLEAGGNIQVVVSQPKENIFAGLNRGISTAVRANDNGALDDTTLNNGTDTGHAFMMKGPDTITGVYNGFLNITPDLGSVATHYAMAFTPTETFTGEAGTEGTALRTGGATGAVFALTTNTGAGRGYGDNADGDLATSKTLYDLDNLKAGPMGGFTVEGFSGMTMKQVSDGFSTAYSTDPSTATACSDVGVNQLGVAGTAGAAGMGCIPFGFQSSIFNTLVGMKMQGGMTQAEAIADVSTSDIQDMLGATLLNNGFQPLFNTNLSSFSDGKQDSAFEYMTDTTFRTFDTFVNAKSQYVYNMPENKDLDVAARFKSSTQDGVNYSINTSYNYDKNPIIDLSWRGATGQKLKTLSFQGMSSVGATTNLQVYDPAIVTAGEITTAATVGVSGAAPGLLTDNTGLYGGNATTGRPATLQFSQEVKRVKQIGGSFDMAIETAALGPVVIRGEALYTKDGYSPVMNKDKLAIGDLVGALQMVKGDRAKIVLGADITAMTNMMISAQFIQDSNLDFVDNGSNYTTDYATMHLSNGFNKAIKDKNFYSLFFSKPFGASGEHRWNNITMLEEGVGGNGKWNRLDAEFSIDDDTQATVEYNKYWGNVNTQFGQLEKSSNIQVGVKYSF